MVKDINHMTTYNSDIGKGLISKTVESALMKYSKLQGTLLNKTNMILSHYSLLLINDINYTHKLFHYVYIGKSSNYI